MSYILDALRKAERERNAGLAPDLQTPMRSEPQRERLPKRRIRMAFGAALLMIVSLSLALWLKPAGTPSQTVAVVPAVGPPAAINTRPAEVPPASTQLAAEPETAQPQAANLDDLLDKNNESLPLGEQQKLSAAAAEVTPQKNTSPQPASVTASAPTPAEETIAPTATKKVQLENAEVDTTLPPELKKLKEMPSDYRANFPAIRVDVHAYDEQPAKRFVMINGRRYREGGTLVEGPQIVSIEEDGIIFNYRNEEVLYPIAR